VQSGATTLRTTTNVWTQDNPSSSTMINPRLTGITTTLNDVSPIQQSKVELDYTTNGNVSEFREFDYGLLLVRKTQTDYLTTSAYTTAHILDRPSQVRVYDGSGTLVARTDFTYDSYSSNPMTVVTGAAQHDDTNYGSNFTTRGNITSTTRYPSLPSTTQTITRNFTYDTLGNQLTAQVDCCQLEQRTFTSATQYAYPTTITRGPSGTQLSVQRTSDFATGLLLTAQDENQQTTTFGYDFLDRLTSITRPDNVAITTSYDDNSAQPAVDFATLSWPTLIV